MRQAHDYWQDHCTRALDNRLESAVGCLCGCSTHSHVVAITKLIRFTTLGKEQTRHRSFVVENTVAQAIGNVALGWVIGKLLLVAAHRTLWATLLQRPPNQWQSTGTLENGCRCCHCGPCCRVLHSRSNLLEHGNR